MQNAPVQPRSGDVRQIRIPDATWKRIQEMAAASERTAAGEVRHALRYWVGELPEGDKR